MNIQVQKNYDGFYDAYINGTKVIADKMNAESARIAAERTIQEEINVKVRELAARN